MKLRAEILHMGAYVEPTCADIDKGEALVLLKVPVEDARKLGPLLFKKLGIEVILSTEKAE